MSAVPSFRPDEYRGALPAPIIGEPLMAPAYRQRADEIVGYTYAANQYCPSCTRVFAAFALAPHDEAAFRGRPSDGDDCETFLDRWAARDGIERDDEWSFDSEAFPKVILAAQASEHDECGRCYQSLLQD